MSLFFPFVVVVIIIIIIINKNEQSIGDLEKVEILMICIWFAGVKEMQYLVYVKIVNSQGLALRAAPRKYQLDVEIVKKWPGLKLSQNKALWALVTKSLV